MDKESLRLVCNPEDEADMITQYEHFGWVMADRKEVCNSREVFDGAVSFSGPYGTGTNIHSHVESEHFISYLVQRDRDMDNYEKIVEIERSYWENRNKYLKGIKDLNDKKAALEKAGSKTENRYMLLLLLCIMAGVLSLILALELGLTVNRGFLALLILTVLAAICAVPTGKKYYEVRNKVEKDGPKEIERALESDNAALTSLSNTINHIWSIVPKTNSLEANKEIEATTSESKEEKLKELKKCHDDGLIDDDEYKARKDKLLG